MTLRRTLSLWVPVALYVSFIFWLSSAPRKAPPLLRWYGADKLIHFCEYNPLGFLLLRAFGRPRWKPSLGSGLIVGALDEFFQGFVPTRTASPWDFLADTCGILLGLAIYRWRTAKTP